MLATLTSRIEAAGWGWRVEKLCGLNESSATILTADPTAQWGWRAHCAEGPTPELALSNAEAKAIAACALEAA